MTTTARTEIPVGAGEDPLTVAGRLAAEAGMPTWEWMGDKVLVRTRPGLRHRQVPIADPDHGFEAEVDEGQGEWPDWASRVGESRTSWHPTLDNMERKTDRPQDRPRPLTDTARREDALQVIGTWDCCWCGQGRGHGWPGKDDGKPHPGREAAAA